MMYRPSASGTQPQMLLPTTYQIAGNQIYQVSIGTCANATVALYNVLLCHFVTMARHDMNPTRYRMKV